MNYVAGLLNGAPASTVRHSVEIRKFMLTRAHPIIIESFNTAPTVSIK